MATEHTTYRRGGKVPFPEAKRVIYAKNPLNSVICQLRFPPILRIDTQPPAGFQEAIRARHPLYQTKKEVTQEALAKLNVDNTVDPVPGMFNTSTSLNHEFLSEDRHWKINLTRTFLAITCEDYERWDVFSERFRKPFEALRREYNPPFFTRIGLRYVDVFERSKLGLGTCDWRELLKPHVLGLVSTDIAAHVRSCESVYQVALTDGESTVRIASSFVKNAETGEQCYMLDSDFFTNKKQPVDKAFDKLVFLHVRATRLLRFMITDKLHNAMEPEEI